MAFSKVILAKFLQKDLSVPCYGLFKLAGVRFDPVWHGSAGDIPRQDRILTQRQFP